MSYDKLPLHERYLYIYNCEKQQKVRPFCIKWFNLPCNDRDTGMRSCLSVLFTPILFNGTGVISGPIYWSLRKTTKTSIMTPGDQYGF